MNQTTALQTVFARLAERGTGCNDVVRFGINMPMALQVQAQCRATLETLAIIKNPPTVFARHANIAQTEPVNNAMPALDSRVPSRKRPAHRYHLSGPEIALKCAAAPTGNLTPGYPLFSNSRWRDLSSIRARGASKMYGRRPPINLPSTGNAASAQPGTGVEDADTSNWRAPRCPDCGSGLIRVRRRPVDRLLSALVPVRRFRCSGMQCGYEGNVAKTAIRKRHAWLALAGYLMATIAGVPVILGASYLTAPKPAVSEESQVNADPTGGAAQPSSPVGQLAFASSLSPTNLSEPLPVHSPGTRPSDFEPGLLISAVPDRGAGMRSADATSPQGFAGGGQAGATSSFPAAASSYPSIISTGGPISPTAGSAILAPTGPSPGQASPLGGSPTASGMAAPRLLTKQTEKPLSRTVSIAPGSASTPVDSADSTIAASVDPTRLATLTTQAVEAAARQAASPLSTSTDKQIRNSAARSSMNEAVDFTQFRDSRGDEFVPITRQSAGTAHPSEVTDTNSVSLLDRRSRDDSGLTRQGGGLASLDITGSTPQVGGLASAELGHHPTDAEGRTVLAAATHNFGAVDAPQAAPVQEAAPNAIPEPTTLALLGIGLVGLGFSRRKR